MDAKERSIITRLFDKINSSNFTESDVYTFLIAIRPYASEGGAVKEFSHFVAHREKDRGHIHQYLKTTMQKIFKDSGTRTITIKPVFTEEEILASFNEIFKKNDFQVINLETAQKLILCIISLLQSVNIFEKKEKIGHLEFSYDKDNIILSCVAEIPIENPIKHRPRG